MEHGHGSFDERAATWDDDPAMVERARLVADAIRAALPLGPSVRMLEYGAGTGLVTQALRDAVGPVTLVDTSSGMRDVMQRKVAEGALPDARIWSVDLASEAPPPDEQFDLVVTVMTLHHIPDVAPVLAAFARLLVDGGHLWIADLEEEDGSFHGDGFAGHHGFNRPTLQAALGQAGFRDVVFHDGPVVVRNGTGYPLFMVACVRGGAPG